MFEDQTHFSNIKSEIKNPENKIIKKFKIKPSIYYPQIKNEDADE